MNKYLLILLLLMVTIGCTSRKVINRLEFDEKSQKDILIGYCNLNGLKSAPFNEWFDFELEDYQPNPEFLVSIENNGGLSDVDITIVMGTWCSDSKREVPRFFKIIQSLGYKSELIKIINVNRKKKAKGTSVSKLKIERVPTFIFYRNDKELGRIIETPKATIEEDILSIVGE